MKVGQRIVEVIFKGVDNTSGAFSDMQRKLGQMGKDVPALGAAFDLLKNPISIATAAVVGMAAAIKNAYDNSVRLGASFEDMSNRTDMSVESLARWKFIAEQSGSSIEEFELAFRKLRNTMADAATGNQAAIDVFNRLGISATDSNGNMRDLETVLLEIGQAVREHGAASIQGAAAQDALGRSSAGVVAIIKQESDELRAQMGVASSYTSHMTTQWAKIADAADDSAARAKAMRENLDAAFTEKFGVNRVKEAFMALTLMTFDKEGWKKIVEADWESARAAGHQVAESYVGSLIKGISAGPSESALASYKKAPLLDLANKFKVPTTEKKWSEESGAFIDVPRTSDAIAADIIKAQEEGVKKAGEKAREAVMAAEAASYAPPIELITPEIMFTMEEEQRKKTEDAFQQLLSDILEIDLSEMNVRLGAPVEDPGPKKISKDLEKLKDIANEAAASLQEIGVTAVDAFLNGEAGAMKFGDMIKRTITRAVAEAIVKFLVMKAISLALGGARDGGAVAGKRAFGGRIPGYAGGGYAVPDGPRGMDSRLIMAMPGEEVINRQLSMRLDRMVTSFEMGAAVSPFALSGAGGGRSTVINFNVARPVNVLDALSLGKDAVTASRKYSEALL